ncbi:hypothetical protein DL96DRAFT_1714080 [Flagelloscypha sp. PMI_526]|nr:hypothetical protein DL96DRAFT_1714080 [Flagelloscypha sp. PMI_526]
MLEPSEILAHRPSLSTIAERSTIDWDEGSLQDDASWGRGSSWSSTSSFGRWLRQSAFPEQNSVYALNKVPGMCLPGDAGRPQTWPQTVPIRRSPLRGDLRGLRNSSVSLKPPSPSPTTSPSSSKRSLRRRQRFSDIDSPLLPLSAFQSSSSVSLHSHSQSSADSLWYPNRCPIPNLENARIYPQSPTLQTPHSVVTNLSTSALLFREAGVQEETSEETTPALTDTSFPSGSYVSAPTPTKLLLHKDLPTIPSESLLFPSPVPSTTSLPSVVNTFNSANWEELQTIPSESLVSPRRDSKKVLTSSPTPTLRRRGRISQIDSPLLPLSIFHSESSSSSTSSPSAEHSTEDLWYPPDYVAPNLSGEKESSRRPVFLQPSSLHRNISNVALLFHNPSEDTFSTSSSPALTALSIPVSKSSTSLSYASFVSDEKALPPIPPEDSPALTSTSLSSDSDDSFTSAPELEVYGTKEGLKPWSGLYNREGKMVRKFT